MCVFVLVCSALWYCVVCVAVLLFVSGLVCVVFVELRFASVFVLLCCLCLFCCVLRWDCFFSSALCLLLCVLMCLFVCLFDCAWLGLLCVVLLRVIVFVCV